MLTTIALGKANVNLNTKYQGFNCEEENCTFSHHSIVLRHTMQTELLVPILKFTRLTEKLNMVQKLKIDKVAW